MNQEQTDDRTHVISDVCSNCTHKIVVPDHLGRLPLLRELICLGENCTEGTHEVVRVVDVTMNKNQPHYPVVFLGIRVGAYEDDAGRVKYSYYDFRHKAILLDLPRVIDGYVTFQW